jgi:hypothetical protein
MKVLDMTAIAISQGLISGIACDGVVGVAMLAMLFLAETMLDESGLPADS